MNIKYRLGYTLLLMIFVAVSVTAIALYMVNKNVERDVRFNLTELLNNRVASIKTLYISGHVEDTIAKFLKITNQNYIGTGNTDEFTIVKKEGDSIHFLVNQRNLGYMNLAPILYKDNKSQAISKALSGKSGFIKNIDYRNKDVYSSYAYIPELKWGITCEIDVDEINQNLFHDFKIILAISILIAIISAFIYNIINNKLLNSLQKSQKKYQNLVENIKEVIYEIDNLGVIKYISPAIEKILGYTPSEITGRNFINFVGENAEYLAARLSLLTTKNEIENEYKLETKTGETRWILFSTIAIITNGKLTGASGTLVDITEKKLIDLELQKSEALYSSIIEASPDVITITNLEGKILLTSPKTFELFGYDTYEDFVNKSIFEFIDESDRTKAISNIMNMHIDELWGAEDYKGVKKDGTIIDVSVNGEFIRDENGQPVNLIFITRDVTERKSLEQELKKTKDLYSSILNASPDAIVTTDLQGKILLASPSTLEVYGIEKEGDVIGRSMFDFLDKRELEKANQNMIRMFNNEIEASIEYLGVKGDGTTINLDVRGNFIKDTNGNPINIVFVARDITEKKKTQIELIKNEEKYRGLVESINDVIYEVTVEGIVNFISPAIEKILGYKTDEIIGKSIFTFMYEEDIERVSEILSHLDEKNHLFLEYRYKTKDGDIVWVRSSTAPIYENDKLVGGNGVLLDITDEKAAAEIINKANRINNVTSHINNAIVKIKDKKELLEEVCKIAVSYGDFEMSWVGLVEESSKDLIKYASAGDVNDYLKKVGGFTIDVSKPKGNGPTATSLRRRVPITCNDIANDVMMQDWKAIALQNNFKSLIALPIKVKDDIIGAFTLYSSIINFFNEEEIKLLVNVTNNIGFAIDAIETENERQEAIIALIESEGRYKTFFDDNSSIMILVDPASGEIRDANPAACNFYGWEKAELCSMNIKDVNLISDEDVVSNMQSIKVGDKKHFVVKHILANCDIKDVEVYSGLITYNNEKLLFSIIHDITDRRIIEEKLVTSEELWRSIIKTTPDGMSITALDGTLQFVSDNLVKWHGYDSRDDFIGKKAFEFLVPNSVKYAEERLVRMLNGEIKNSAVYELLRKDGSTFFVEVNAEFMRNKDGIPKSILLIERDITDRIIVEESLRKLSRAVEQSPVITYITNINGEIEYVNPKTVEITGYSKEELIGMNPRIFSSGLNSKEMYSDLFHTVKLGKQWEGEFYNKKKNGELFYVKAIITPIINEEGNTTNYLAIQNDITIQKQAENDLKESQLRTAAILNSIADTFYSVDDKWRLSEVNHAAELAPWGRPASELIGKVIWDIAPALVGTRIQKYYLDAAENKSMEQYTALSPLNNCWYEVFMQGRIGGVDVYMRDITKRKQAEEQIIELNSNLELKVQERTEELAHTNEYLQKEIEGRKKISQALNEAYDRLYKIADRIPGVVYQYQLNPDGTSSFPFSSKGIYDIYQVTPEEVSVDASLVIARLHPEDYDEVIASITKSAKDQELWRHEYRVKFEDGTVRWLLGNAMPQLEPDGSVLWHGFISDITEQKESENKLIEIEKRFSLFMDNLPGIVFMKDSESRLLYTNTAMDIALGASKWIGLESDEIFGSEESARIKADDQLTIQLGYQEIKESFYNLDGEIHYYETQKFAIPIKGQLPLIGAVAIDITQRTKIEEELKKIEQSYQTVVENVNEVIFQTDTEGLWVFLNKSWEVITGFSAGESLGQLFLNYVHPDDRQRNMELFEPLIKREKDYCRHEIRYLTKDGGFRWIEVYARLGLNAKNEITGTYGTLQDITERRKKEEELKQLSTRLSLATHSGGIGVWDFDIENDILVWDDQMYALYGITSTEFSGAYDAWQQGLHPEDKVQGDIEIQMAINGEKDFDTEFRVVWPDGTIRNIKAQAIVLHDESGKCVHLIGTNWDITDQKYAEKALKESEASHVSMITNISDVIGIMGVDGVMKYKSPNIEKYFGWKPEDLVGFDGWHTVHPDDLERISKEFGELIKEDNNAKTVEYRYKCKDGSYKPIELTATNLVNDKIINGVLLNYHDITDRKEAENLLEQTRQNYETFFNTIDDFLWVLDEQGNIIHANSTVKTRLEYPAEELMNKSVLLVHPTDRREEAGRIVGEMLRGEAEFCPVPIVTKSNKQIPVETRVKPGFWNGQSVIFGVSKDVSQIQLSEQKFSSAFQANAAMMAISHFKHGIYFDVNNAFTEVMGYTYDEIIGKTNKEHSLFVDSNLREEILNKLDNKIPVRKMEIQMRTKDGTIKTGLMSADIIYIGDIKCLLTVNVDISERIKAEEETKLARLEAEKANIAKSEFLSRMSHELRTPMNSILGFAQILELGELNTSQKRGVGHILKSGKHLLDLINEVLDISRIESGSLSLSLEPVQIDEIIKEMIDVFQPHLAEKQLSFDYKETPTNLLCINSDRQRLKQVLLNLINNAIKYNRNEGAIEIKTELISKNNTNVKNIRILISDNGIGISPDNIQKIFVPFERIGAEKTEIEGTGLGLSVVKKLIEAMGGSIGVESVPDQGSTFWIELPSIESQSEDDVRNETTLNSSLINLDKKGTILYIEDNKPNIALVEQILSSQRPGVNLVSNAYGKNTVKLAIEYKPDIILLDLNLPDIHGSEVIELLKKNEATRNIPVVILTADAMSMQHKKLIKAGAKSYITKPLDVMVFLMEMDKWMEN